MIRLDSTLRSLEVILGGAITTNQLPVTTSWSDSSSGSYLGGSNLTNTNSGTAVTAAAAPAAGVVRDVDFFNVYNADTVSTTVTVRVNDNGTFYTVQKAALAVGDALLYTHGGGWMTLDSSGRIKTTTATAGIGTIGSSTDNAVARWDGTGGTNIQNSAVIIDDSNNITGVVALTITGTLTMSGVAANIALGSNFISNAGTDAGFSLDASNNATLSGDLTVVGTANLTGSVQLGDGSDTLTLLTN